MTQPGDPPGALLAELPPCPRCGAHLEVELGPGDTVIGITNGEGNRVANLEKALRRLLDSSVSDDATKAKRRAEARYVLERGGPRGGEL
jgi:hypothetical protein